MFKTLVAKMLTGAAGLVVTPFVAKYITIVVTYIAMISPESAATVDQAAIQAWIMSFITALIMYLVVRPERKQTEEIQKVLGEVLNDNDAPFPTGLSHVSTTEAVKQVVDKVKGIRLMMNGNTDAPVEIPPAIKREVAAQRVNAMPNGKTH